MDVKTSLLNFRKDLEEGFKKYAMKNIDQLKYKEVWFFGMGASAIAPMVLKNINSRINVVNTNLFLKEGLNNSGKVGISYSGNTEEVIANIEKFGVDILITSNGKLKKIAEEKKVPMLEIPKGIVPRASFAYLFTASLYAAYYLGAINSDQLRIIKEKILNMDYEKQKNKAKKLAENIENKIIYILADTLDFTAAYRIKTQLNENAKMFCFIEELPEANHNSLMMWKNKEVREHIHPIIIESQDEFVKESQEYLYNKILKKEATIIRLEEKDKIKRTFELIHLGDWLSYYLGKKRKVRIEDTTIIEDLKRYRRMKK